MIPKIDKSHIWAVLFLAGCATGYLFDVLFLDKHLSAFDIILNKPSWKVEFGDIRPNNMILADSPTAHYPYKKEFWDASRQGYNTQYLPHIFTGKPTVGQGIGMMSTSLFQFVMDIPDALDWSTWFRLLLASVLMYVFLVQLGAGAAAATLGSIAWTYNMHQIAWLMFPHHLGTQLWLPLLLTLNIVLLKNRSSPGAALGLIFAVIFFFTSGYTQIVLYSLIYLGLFNILYLLFVQSGPWRERLKTWFYIPLIYLLAGALLLPEALWQGQEIAEGLRGSQEFRYSTNELVLSFGSIGSLISDLLPNAIEASRFLMPNYESELGYAPSLKQFFKSNTVEYQVYFGLVCLYLALLGLIRGVFGGHRQLIVFAVLLLLCIGLLNGNETLVALLGLVPFGGAGSYSRIATLILFTASIFVAFGARYFVEDLTARRFVPIGSAFLVLVGWLAAAKWQHMDLLAVKEFAPWFAYLAVFIVAAILLARFRKTGLVLPIAVAASFTELVLAGYHFNTRLDARHHFPANTIISQIQAADGDFRTALLMDHTGYHHNVLTYYDLSTIGGYSTVVPNDYVYFMRKAYEKVHVTLNGIMFLFDGNLPILRLLNTRFIVSNLPLESGLIKPVYSNEVETLYEFRDPLGRAYCASHQVINDKRTSIPAQLANLASQYDRPVILESGLVEESTLTENCEVTALRAYTSKLTFKVETDRPSIVFLPINHHMYWDARVGGQDAEIRKANYAFMALAVPAGASDVELSFVNRKLTVGAVISILFGIAAIVIALTRVHSRWQIAVIIIFGALLIGRNLLSVPGVMNMDIPERTAVKQSRPDSAAGRSSSF